MKTWWSIPIFAAGLVVGAAIVPQFRTQSEEAKAEGDSTRPTRRTPHSSRPVEHDTKWNTFARSAGRMSGEEKETWLKNLKASDRISALEALLSQAGPQGLPYDVQHLMENILANWAKEDFDGAWKWSEHCQPDKFRSFAKKALLGSLLDRDAARALELHIAQVKEDPEFTSRVSGHFIEKAAMGNAGDFVDLLSKLSFQRGARGTAMNFAENFDFKAAADGLAAMTEGREDRPYEFPSNFIEEWCKSDLEGAHQWLMKHDSLPFGGWSDVFEAVEISHGLEEAGAWAAREIEQAGENRARLLGALGGLPHTRAEAGIRSIVTAIPDVPAKDQFLADFVTQHPHSMKGITGAALSLLSTPEARLAAFRAIHKEGGYVDLDDITPSKFQEWGITRAQVAEITEKE